MQATIDALGRTEPPGWVAALAAGPVPAGRAGWAYDRAPYGVRPPLSRRRLRDEGPRGRSWSHEHPPQPRQAAAGAACPWSGRRGPPIRPHGLPRLRSDGLPAPGQAKQGQAGLPRLLVARGRGSQGT